MPYVYYDGSDDAAGHLMMLRIDSSGVYDDIRISDYSAQDEGISWVNIITNADTGVLLTWDSLLVNPNRTPHMAIITGSSVSLVSPPEVPGLSRVVEPALQAQDGSFVGTGISGLGTSQTSSIVAFDATGNVRWTVPNDEPRIATDDGGVIGKSGTTYNQNGSAMGQIGTLPIYSWKGAYQVGSVKSIVSWFRDRWSQFPTSTTDLWDGVRGAWMWVGGNHTGNGTAFRKHVFTLNWCANNSCQLAYAPQFGGPSKTDSDVDFFYAKARVGSLPNPRIELGASQIATVKNMALDALKKAFQAFPVTVLDIRVDAQQAFTNMVEVSGSYYAFNCGLTAPNKSKSTAWYECHLVQAQFPLNLQDTDLSSNTGSADFTRVLRATGEGIGNTAAHEIAHQFLEFFCGMNDDKTKVGVYDGGNADSGQDPAMYTGFGPNGQPLVWSRETAICLVNKMLLGHR